MDAVLGLGGQKGSIKSNRRIILSSVVGGVSSWCLEFWQ